MVSNEETVKLFRQELVIEQTRLQRLLDTAAKSKCLLDAHSRVRLATMNLNVVERASE